MLVQNKFNLLKLLIVAFALNACSMGDNSVPHFKIGNPYQIEGVTYVPKIEPNYIEEGVASWYGEEFHGRKTANGEVFDKHSMTAAHRTLPLPSYVVVENLENGKKVTVRVNDRGPFAKNRIIDMSMEAAEKLGFKEKGTAKVKVTYLKKASLDAITTVQTKEEDAQQLKLALGSPYERSVYEREQQNKTKLADASSIISSSAYAATTPAKAASASMPSFSKSNIEFQSPSKANPRGYYNGKSIPASQRYAKTIAESSNSYNSKGELLTGYNTSSNQYNSTIQLGAFSNLESAIKFTFKDRALYDSRIKESFQNGRKIYKVQIGEYNSKEEALANINRYKAIGVNDAFVVTGQ